MIRGRQWYLLTSGVAAVILAVVTVLGIITGAGLSPVLTGCLAVVALCSTVRLAVGGDRS